MKNLKSLLMCGFIVCGMISNVYAQATWPEYVAAKADADDAKAETYWNSGITYMVNNP